MVATWLPVSFLAPGADGFPEPSSWIGPKRSRLQRPPTSRRLLPMRTRPRAESLGPSGFFGLDTKSKP